MLREAANIFYDGQSNNHEQNNSNLRNYISNFWKLMQARHTCPPWPSEVFSSLVLKLAKRCPLLNSSTGSQTTYFNTVRVRTAKVAIVQYNKWVTLHTADPVRGTKPQTISADRCRISMHDVAHYVFEQPVTRDKSKIDCSKRQTCNKNYVPVNGSTTRISVMWTMLLLVVIIETKKFHLIKMPNATYPLQTHRPRELESKP